MSMITDTTPKAFEGYELVPYLVPNSCVSAFSVIFEKFKIKGKNNC